MEGISTLTPSHFPHHYSSLFSSSKQNMTQESEAGQPGCCNTTQLCFPHSQCPHTQAGQTPVNHRKFRKFKTEHQHFQSQQVPVSPPHQQGMGPGEGKAEAASDLGSPSAEDEPRHTATSRCCVHSHSREQEFSPPGDFPAAPRNSS